MEQAVLTLFNLSGKELIGEGIEASIYAINEHQVLRIYKQSDAQQHHRITRMMQFYKTLHTRAVDFAVPQILSVREHEGIFYSIDQRLEGRPLAQITGKVSPAVHQKLLLQYVEAAEHIRQLHGAYSYFGEILATEPIRCNTWPEFLKTKTARAYAGVRDMFDEVMPQLPDILAFVAQESALVADAAPRLVHGDYHSMNVLADDAGKVTAVIDFNELCLAGDPRLDLASGVIGFMEQENGLTRADGEYLLDYLDTAYGQNMRRIIHLYRVYFAIVFASYCRDSDPPTYRWAIRSLREHLEQSYEY